MFVRSSRSAAAEGHRLNVSNRGDIHSERLGSTPGRQGRLFVDERGLTVRGSGADSDAVTYSQLDPNTSDADVLGGGSTRVIWGTNVSIPDTMAAFRNFLLNYTKKYRMWADGATEEETKAQANIADQKEYVEMMRGMRQLGITGLNLDVRNLKAYPPTVKLWHQLQSYPQEVVPLMDQIVKDVMVDEAAKEMSERRTRQQHRRSRNSMVSSEPAMPSSERNGAGGNTSMPASTEPDLIADVESRTYKIRPFGLDQSINLRDLDPSGKLLKQILLCVC